MQKGSPKTWMNSYDHAGKRTKAHRWPVRFWFFKNLPLLFFLGLGEQISGVFLIELEEEFHPLGVG